LQGKVQHWHVSSLKENMHIIYIWTAYFRAEDEPGQSSARSRQASATFVTAVVIIADMALIFAAYNTRHIPANLRVTLVLAIPHPPIRPFALIRAGQFYVRCVQVSWSVPVFDRYSYATTCSLPVYWWFVVQHVIGPFLHSCVCVDVIRAALSASASILRFTVQSYILRCVSVVWRECPFQYYYILVDPTTVYHTIL
jgi:hypothetical protein